MNHLRCLLLAFLLGPGAISRGEEPAPSPAAIYPTEEPDGTRYLNPRNAPNLQKCIDRVTAMKGQPCNLVFVGASIIQYWTTKGGAIWNQRYAPLHALDLGVAGDKIQNVLWRLDHLDIREFRPKVAVVLVGSNNTTDTPLAIAAGVKTVAVRLRALFPDVKVILVSITPNARAEEKMMAADQIIRTYADNRSIYYLDLVPLMPPVAVPVPIGSSDVNYKGLGPDGLHPDASGYQIWADAMDPLLKKLLSAPLGRGSGPRGRLHPQSPSVCAGLAGGVVADW